MFNIFPDLLGSCYFIFPQICCAVAFFIQSILLICTFTFLIQNISQVLKKSVEWTLKVMSSPSNTFLSRLSHLFTTFRDSSHFRPFGLKFTKLYLNSFIFKTNFFLKRVSQRLRLQSFSFGEFHPTTLFVLDLRAEIHQALLLRFSRDKVPI